jgi:hypothetical protein
VTDDARRKTVRRYIKRETAHARACEEAGGRLAYMTMTVFTTVARPSGSLYAAAEGDLRRQFPVIAVTYLRLRMPVSCRDPAELTRWFVA